MLLKNLGLSDMKTFQELLEAKKYAKKKEYLKGKLPEDREEYPEALKKELLKRLSPLTEFYSMEIDDLRPITYTSDPANFGKMLVDINTYAVSGGSNRQVASCFSKKEANTILNAIINNDIDCKLVKSKKDNYEVREYLGDDSFTQSDINALVKNAKIDIQSIQSAFDLAEEWFFDEGPELEKFLYDVRGSRAAKKFGFK